MGDLISKHVKLAAQLWDLYKFRRQLKRDPEARNYTDLALAPVQDEELDAYEMLSPVEAAK